MVNIPADWDSRPPPAMTRRVALFRPDHKSFGKFILSEQMRDPVVEICRELIVPLARQNTPRGPERGQRHMADRYKVVREGGTMKVDRALRVVVRVENDDPASAAVEFGGRFNKRRRMLGRAAATVGDMKGDIE
jgi:hypothetical protein